MGGLHPYQAVSPERRLRSPFQSMSYHALELLVDAAPWTMVRQQIRQWDLVSHMCVRLCNDLPASARSQFRRHLARGGSVEKKDRAEERTRRRAARDCRGGAGRLRVTLRRMCTPTCDLFCSENLHIGGSGAWTAAENEIMSWHRYDTRCGEFWLEPAEFCSGIVGFCKRRLTWIEIDVNLVLGATYQM